MANRNEPVKLLVAGPVGAGKTTAIGTLAGTAPVSATAPASQAVHQGRQGTSIVFDYATVALDDGAALHIYGLPGQAGVDFMHTIMARGALGALVLLDATSKALCSDCAYWLETLKRVDPALAFVIGVTKVDSAPGFSIADVRDIALQAGVSAPVLTIDARNPGHVRQLIRLLLLSL